LEAMNTLLHTNWCSDLACGTFPSTSDMLPMSLVFDDLQEQPRHVGATLVDSNFGVAYRVLSLDFLQGEYLRSWVGRQWCLCIIFLLGGVAFGEPFCLPSVVLSGVCGLLLRGVDHYGEAFFPFSFSFSGYLHPRCLFEKNLAQRLCVMVSSRY
jgi:hypothetical protein